MTHMADFDAMPAPTHPSAELGPRCGSARGSRAAGGYAARAYDRSRLGSPHRRVCADVQRGSASLGADGPQVGSLGLRLREGWGKHMKNIHRQPWPPFVESLRRCVELMTTFGLRKGQMESKKGSSHK